MIANNRHVDFWAPVLVISGLLMVLIALVLGHVAHADPEGWQPPADPGNSISTVLLWVTFALSVAANVLHFVAPRTKTTVDDKLRDDLDEALAWIRGTGSGRPTSGGPPTSSSSATTGLLLLLAAGALTLQPGCSSGKHAAVTGKDAVIHCAKADAGPILALTAELATAAAASALHSGHVDWKALATRAESAGLEVGGCAFAALYHALEKDTPVARSMVAEPDLGRAALEQLRAGFGGARWEIAGGAVL